MMDTLLSFGLGLVVAGVIAAILVSICLYLYVSYAFKSSR